MRPLSIATILASLLLPAAAIAGPAGTFHVKGVNPDDGSEYAGTVNITRKGEVYRVVWKIGADETVGIGIGLRIVDGQMIAGAASDRDTAISVSYASDKTPGNATYTEFSDGTWRGVWAYKGYRKVSTEEWIPTVRQIATKSIVANDKSSSRDTTDFAADSQPARVEEAETDEMTSTPTRIMSSPLPANASPKS